MVDTVETKRREERVKKGDVEDEKREKKFISIHFAQENKAE